MRAIVFDLDGTLVDSRQDITESIVAALERLNTPRALNRAAIGALVGRPLTEMLSCAGPDLDAAGVERAAAAYREHFAKHCRDHSRLYDGVWDLLDALRSRCLLGCATTKRPEPTARVLDTFELTPLFQAWRGTGEEMAFKPEPDVLLAVAQDLEIPPESMWYVGDTAGDLVAARRAGARPVWARWGYGDPDACEAAQPSLALDTPADLLAGMPPQ